MFNVCYNCGQIRADKVIDPKGPFAICPLCQHRHPFRQLPLLMVCGPSAAGKSTVCQRITGAVEEVIALDADILWRPEFNKPDDHYRDFYETWLRLGKNIAQSGRPLVLFNSGAIPENIEPCIERRYFSEVHYLAFVCQDDVLVTRLKQRPAWRQSHAEQFIEGQRTYNRWLKDQGGKSDSKIQLLDTTNEPVEATVEQAATWIRAKIS
jgi:hypothetical protein